MVEILMPPVLSKLPEHERVWVLAAQQLMAKDLFFENGGFDTCVNPRFIGFSIDRKEQKAMPVYHTDNGVFAVKIRGRSAITIKVAEEDVYRLD